jgi:hypothetical protein
LHKATDVLETRTITTPAGIWGAVVVDSGFTNLQTADILIIGVAIDQVNDVKLLTIERGGDTVYSLKTAKYDPEVIRIDDPLPHVADFLEGVASTNQGPQQPIIAQAVGNVGAGRAEFKIAPGFNYYRGTSRATTAAYVDLALKEPAIDDFFNDYLIELNVGSGVNAKITDYVGSTRRATLNVNPGIGGPLTYRLTAPPSGFFSGYAVEQSASPAGPWAFVSSTPTTKLNVNGLQSSSNYFRFLPVSGQGNENFIGPWVVQLSAGDVTGPTPPTAVNIVADGRDVTVQISYNYPLGRDIFRINILIDQTMPGGTNVNAQTFEISNQRNEDNTSGSNTVSVFYNASALAAGTLLYARANIEDYFDNVSPWVNSPTGATIAEDSTTTTTPTASAATSPGTIIVTNTTIETVVAGGTITGGSLGISGLARLCIFLRITDNDATHDATVTLRFKWKGATLVTLVCRTSDDVSNLGDEIAWKVTGFMALKGTTTDAICVLEKIGLDTITDRPYPGMAAKIDSELTGGLETETSGDLTLTVQLSMASTGLSVVKVYSWIEFITNAVAPASPVTPPESPPGTPQE